MENFEERLKKRLSPLHDKLDEALQKAGKLQQEIVTLREEVADFVKQELEARKKKLVQETL